MILHCTIGQKRLGIEFGYPLPSYKVRIKGVVRLLCCYVSGKGGKWIWFRIFLYQASLEGSKYLNIKSTVLEKSHDSCEMHHCTSQMTYCVAQRNRHSCCALMQAKRIIRDMGHIHPMSPMSGEANELESITRLKAVTSFSATDHQKSFCQLIGAQCNS